MLLNYTTKVPTARTLTEVQRILVDAGAAQIMVDYIEGRPTAVAFTVDTPVGPRQFVLPVNAAKVHAVLQRERVEPRWSTAEHAERVAWRIVKDWLEAQLAIIRTEMVTLEQVMLPYMTGADGRSTYDRYLEQQRALPAGHGET